MPILTFLTPVVAIFVAFLNKLLGPIARHLKYFFQVSDYVKKLKVNSQDLKARKDDIEKRVLEEVERQSRQSTSQVEVWQQQIDDIMPKVDKILKDYENRSCNSFFNCSNYLTGMRCADKLEQVIDLRNRGSFVVVTVDKTDSIGEIPTTYEVPGLLESNHQKALKYVNDDASARVIGIWGMGGVGKTTLLTKIHNSCITDSNSKFDHVVWIVASRESNNIEKVQKDIVKMLRLKEDSDTQSQANIIYSYFTNKNFLFLIDNLWEHMELHKVGIPSPFDMESPKIRKVLFTTRSLIVCGNMEANVTVKVECLNWKESWLLFTEKVGEQAIQSHPDIPILAEDVARECNGLPLALITIGRAMSTKKSPHDWKYSIDLMKKSRLDAIPGTEESKVAQILKISYDSLANDKLKKCFLCISMWPEDYNICKDELIQCWMGLDIIEDFERIDEAYRIGYSLIGSLQAACLLEEGDEDEREIGGLCVKMHDVLRDMALWIASDCGENINKWMVKSGFGLRQAPNMEVKWREAERISLMHNLITELPSNIPSCPNLTTLMLQNTLLRHNPSLNCFLHLHALKYLDLSNTSLHVFPQVICALTELLYLNISNTDISELPWQLKKLKKLKYLILRDTAISTFPEGVISELVRLLVLDVFTYSRYTWGSLVDELRFVENQLIFLGVTVWSEEDLNKLVLFSDLCCIRALCLQDLRETSFHIVSRVTNNNSIWINVKELILSDCHRGLIHLVVDKNEANHEDFPSLSLETLCFSKLVEFKRIIWRDVTPKKLFPELRKVTFSQCNSLENITWVSHLPSLEYLEIRTCPGMRIAINKDDDDDDDYEVDSISSSFPLLKILVLRDLEVLQTISVHALAFPELRYFEVAGCPLLRKLSIQIEFNCKIQKISGQIEWWNHIEWENDYIRTYFNTVFKDSSTQPTGPAT